jgi:hypothetical protein
MSPIVTADRTPRASRASAAIASDARCPRRRSAGCQRQGDGPCPWRAPKPARRLRARPEVDSRRRIWYPALVVDVGPVLAEDLGSSKSPRATFTGSARRAKHHVGVSKEEHESRRPVEGADRNALEALVERSAATPRPRASLSVSTGGAHAVGRFECSPRGSTLRALIRGRGAAVKRCRCGPAWPISPERRWSGLASVPAPRPEEEPDPLARHRQSRRCRGPAS